MGNLVDPGVYLILGIRVIDNCRQQIVIGEHFILLCLFYLLNWWIFIGIHTIGFARVIRVFFWITLSYKLIVLVHLKDLEDKFKLIGFNGSDYHFFIDKNLILYRVLIPFHLINIWKCLVREGNVREGNKLFPKKNEKKIHEKIK